MWHQLNKREYLFKNYVGLTRKQTEQWLGCKGAVKQELGIFMGKKTHPTWGSCSVAGALPTSFSQSAIPFPPGPWGCIVLPASLFPELL